MNLVTFFIAVVGLQKSALGKPVQMSSIVEMNPWCLCANWKTLSLPLHPNTETTRVYTFKWFGFRSFCCAETPVCTSPAQALGGISSGCIQRWACTCATLSMLISIFLLNVVSFKGGGQKWIWFDGCDGCFCSCRQRCRTICGTREEQHLLNP